MQVFVKNNGFESNLSNARNFSLGDPNVICRILSDYLYSNKIGSIVRELSANAIDAHRLGNCLDKPFEVHVPGTGEGLFDINTSDFSVRDFGPGLSEQGIYDLYTSYGASSKRNDQDQIGGFGIGSKSPFAYTKAFEVVSWHKGRKAQYLCFQDESGAPCVKKLCEEDSEEPSGMRVKFSVDGLDDCRRFHSECLFQYSWFNPRPSCNIAIPKLKVLYENEYGVCWSSEGMSSIVGLMPGGRYNTNTYRALVNNYVYSLEDMYSRRTFPNAGYAAMPFNDCWCMLKINGSDVDVSASREELAFTERTERAVAATFNAFIDKAAQELWDAVHEDGKESVFEASWKWRLQKLNTVILANWANKKGLESKYWDFSRSSQSGFQDVSLDGNAIWNFICDTGNGYELVRKSSSSSGFSALSKMTKAVFDKESNCKKIRPNFKRMNYNFSESSEEILRCNIELQLSGCEDFKLAFVKKGTRFSDIKERVRAAASNLGRNGIFHVYAVSSPAEQEMIVAAYKNPSASRIVQLDEPKDGQRKKAKRVNMGNDKRELVRVKTARYPHASNAYGKNELLFNIRHHAKEEWLSIEAIQEKLRGNGVLLVLDGTSLSVAETPATFDALLDFASRSAHKTEMPFEWILMNVASYRKYRSHGGEELKEDLALKAAEGFIETLGVTAMDFRQWAFCVCLEDRLNFGSLNSACDFSSTIKAHMESPIAKAFLKWRSVQDTLGKLFTNTESLARILYGYRGCLCGKETLQGIREEAAKALAIEDVYEWLELNPILNLLRNRYSTDREKLSVAGIVEKYLVWK